MFRLLLSTFLLLPSLTTSYAQTATDFFRAKKVSMYIGYSVGGGYDVYARLVARHLGKHIPGNPSIVPTNMEGAGSIRLANWLYGPAPKDGTAIGTIGRGVPFDALLKRPGIQFDPRNFTWIGSANNEVSVCISWGTSGITKFEQLLEKPLVVGAAGAAADDDQFPKVINGTLGTKMKVVTGYPGGNDVVLAMERGEVGGRCGMSWSSLKSTQPSWLSEKKINILAQLALSKHADLPQVPLILDLAQTEEQRKILRLIFARQSLGRPFLAPPGVPEDRADILRRAFMATMTDPEFKAEAARSDLEIQPVSGKDIADLVSEIYKGTDEKTAAITAELIK